MKQYRIVTNGVKFRIQAYRPKKLFRKAKWVFLGQYSFGEFNIVDFDNIVKAEIALSDIREKDEIKNLEWKEVEQ